MAAFKKALVTGCGRGIGAEVARKLAGQGVELVLINRSADALEAIASEVGAVARYSIDVGNHDGLDSLLDEILAAHPDIDLAVLNAGLDLPQKIDAFDWRIAKQQIDVNLTANYVFASKLIPLLLQNGSGRLAVVSSLGSYAGCPFEHAYNASKAGVRMMIDGLRAELLETPVGVTGIYPGFVATDMIAGNAFDSSSSVTADVAAQKIVDGVMTEQEEIVFPEEMGALVAQVVSMSPIERANVVRSLMDATY